MKHLKTKIGAAAILAAGLSVGVFTAPAWATGSSGCGGGAGNLWPEGCITVNGSGLNISTITSHVTNEGNVTFSNVHYKIYGPSISTYTTPSFNLPPGSSYYGATQYINKNVAAGNYCQAVYEGSTQVGPTYCVGVHA
jgi:hypothetical protein